MNYLIKLNNNIYFAWAKLKIQEVELNNKNLAKIFEYYVCHQLSIKYERPFYLYQDIDPGFKEENNMTMQDTGIDACDLLHCIVQCKLYSGTISLRHCATTFACQNINKGAEGLLIRWPDIIIARNKDSKLSSYLSGHYSSRFIPEEFCKDEMIEFCNKCSYIKEHRDEDFILRPYQEEAIMLINDSCNSCISLPTGTGKNFIIIKSLREGCKYLILVPRIILMEQISEEIKIHRPELYAYVQLIDDGLYNPAMLITISCYNSIHQISDFHLFDKIFIDEAHHIYPPGIYSGEEGEEEEDINEEVILQTADIFGEGDFVCHKKSYINIIRSLNVNVVCLSATIDPIKNFTYYSHGIREMISNKYLCDYTINVPIFHLPDNIATCAYLLREHSGIIIYCACKKEGREITEILNNLQEKSADYIDCKTNKRDRNRIITQFREQKLQFLVNIRVLTEGFDAPSCRGVCFMHMPRSKTMTLQIIGRCLRLHSDKMFAKVILPFVYEEDGKAISSFLRIISENDSRIMKSNIRKQLGGYLNIFPGDISENIEDDHFDYEERYDLIYNSIGRNRMSNNYEAWRSRLCEIKEYIDEHNKLPSYTDKIDYNKLLARWITMQKKYYSLCQNIMKNKYINSLWEDFILNPIYSKFFLSAENLWIEKLDAVKAYININNKRPSKGSNDNSVKRLGQWICTQVNFYNKNERIMKNFNIRNYWHLFITHSSYSKYFIGIDDSWKQTLKETIIYIDRKNKIPSQHSKDPYIRKLGVWFNNQKVNYRSHKKLMSHKNIRNIWSTLMNNPKYIHCFYNTEEIWFKTLKELCLYIDTNKKRPSSESKDATIKKLGQWMQTQTHFYGKKEHIMKNTIIYDTWTDFINNPNFSSYILSINEKWYDKLSKLKIYIDANNKTPSGSSKDKAIKQLGNWLQMQKSNYILIKNSMKNDLIKTAWTTFITDPKYAHLFPLKK